MNKKTHIVLVSLVTLFLLAVFVALVFKGGDEGRDIKIGAVLSLSGATSSFYGEYNKNAIDLAVSEINTKGGVLGRKVTVVYEDSVGDKVAGIHALEKLVQSGVLYVISDISPVSVGIAPIAERNKVILLATSASNPNLTTAGDYVFRTKMAAQHEGVIAADYISEKLKPKSVAFLYQNSDYGTGVFSAFSKKIVDAKIPIVAEEKFAVGATDMRTELTKINSKKPELVIVAGFPKEIGQLLKQSAELGLQLKFFAHSGSIGPDINKIAGVHSVGLIFLTELHRETAEFKKFNQAYFERYGVKPELFASNAYDAVNLIAQSMAECDDNQLISSGDTQVVCVKKNLSMIKGYQGVSGNISFDINGDVTNRDLVCMENKIDLASTGERVVREDFCTIK